jgi:hypothetical protein
MVLFCLVDSHLRPYNAITRRPSPLPLLVHFIVYIIFGLDENWDLAEGQLVVHDCVSFQARLWDYLG